MKNKGISMVSLIIMIIVMIILALIGGGHVSRTINDANSKDAKEEMRNLVDVVGSAKANGLIGKFVPNDDFLCKEEELRENYASVLTEEQINKIIEINNDRNADPLKKYYVLNQDRCDSEFGKNMTNVSGLKREYLVSYYDRVVILNSNGELISSGEINSEQPVYGKITVTFSPDGNDEWATSHETNVSVTGDNITDMRYVMTQSSEEPASILIDKPLTNGMKIKLDGVTGNNWYIWVLVKYDEEGIEKTYLVRSNPFYIDNKEPDFEMEIRGVTK